MFGEVSGQLITRDSNIEEDANASCAFRHEMKRVVELVKQSSEVQAKVRDLRLPDGFEVVVEPWPYGAPDPVDADTRLFQALMFAKDLRTGNPDANFYAYPLPIIPVVDTHTEKVVRIDLPATGGGSDPLDGPHKHEAGVIDHCNTAEYVPELLPKGVRRDLKPLSIIQPYGPSFKVDDGNLVLWQKWSFRVTFNPREGAVLHDIRYEGRSVLYRLSISDMVWQETKVTFR